MLVVTTPFSFVSHPQWHSSRSKEIIYEFVQVNHDHFLRTTVRFLFLRRSVTFDSALVPETQIAGALRLLPPTYFLSLQNNELRAIGLLCNLEVR